MIHLRQSKFQTFLEHFNIHCLLNFKGQQAIKKEQEKLN